MKYPVRESLTLKYRSKMNIQNWFTKPKLKDYITLLKKHHSSPILMNLILPAQPIRYLLANSIIENFKPEMNQKEIIFLCNLKENLPQLPNQSEMIC
jgi:hypothetical protein